MKQMYGPGILLWKAKRAKVMQRNIRIQIAKPPAGGGGGGAKPQMHYARRRG